MHISQWNSRQNAMRARTCEAGERIYCTCAGWHASCSRAVAAREMLYAIQCQVCVCWRVCAVCLSDDGGHWHRGEKQLAPSLGAASADSGLRVLVVG